MILGKSIPIGVVLVVAGTFVANAQPQYQLPQYQAYPYGQSIRTPAPPAQPYPYSRPAPLSHLPPSWFYNPYTDGTVRDPRAGGGS
jgi:hypothetical protein